MSSLLMKPTERTDEMMMFAAERVPPYSVNELP